MHVDPERKPQAEDREAHVVGAIGGREHAAGHVGVEPLVQVGLLELVGGEQSVEELVAELVNRDPFRTVHRGRRRDRGSRGDKRRILHAARLPATPRRIHDRQRVVRVGPEHAAVTGERRARRLQVALRLARMLRLEKQRDVDVMETRFVETVPDDEVGGVCRPGEIVDARLAKTVDDPIARRRGPLLDLPPGRADLAAVADGHVDGDVVVSEVGEELAHGVELVTIPSGLFEHSDLREPLGSEEEVPLVPGAAEHARQP